MNPHTTSFFVFFGIVIVTSSLCWLLAVIRDWWQDFTGKRKKGGER